MHTHIYNTCITKEILGFFFSNFFPGLAWIPKMPSNWLVCMSFIAGDFILLYFCAPYIDYYNHVNTKKRRNDCTVVYSVCDGVFSLPFYYISMRREFESSCDHNADGTWHSAFFPSILPQASFLSCDTAFIIIAFTGCIRHARGAANLPALFAFCWQWRLDLIAAVTDRPIINHCRHMLSADDRAEAELGSAALCLWLWACSWTISRGQDFWVEARFAVTAPQPFPTSTGSLLKTHSWMPPLNAGGNETGPWRSFLLLPWW